jgi:hypothetical protein
MSNQKEETVIMMKNEGLAIHCHHGVLCEYCYSYKERVWTFKNAKPDNEIETRLKLFRILPNEALKDFPVDLRKAYAEWRKAYADWPADEKEKFHAKWCGCKEWNGTEIVFPLRKR